MSATISSIPTRRRAATAAVGLAALALTLGACGEQGTGTEVVGSATSVAGSAAAQATSAAGSAAARATSAAGDGTGGEQPAGEGSGAGNPEEEFLNDLRRVGVEATDQQDYLTRGRDACGSLDGGTGYVDVLKQYGDAHPEAPTTEAPTVVIAAVKALCSQHAPQLGQGDGGEG